MNKINHQYSFTPTASNKNEGKNFTNSIQIQNLVLKNDNELIINDFCAVCNIAFKTFKLEIRYFCKVCGKSTCGECSKKLVNSKRCCDICYLKLINQTQGKRRREYLKSKEKTLKEYKIIKENTIKKIEIEEQRIKDLKKQIELDQYKHADKLEEFQKQTNKMEEILKKTLEKKNGSEKILENDMTIFSEKSTVNERIKLEIQNIRTKIEDYKSLYYLQSEKLEDLKQQYSRIMTSPSFITMNQEKTLDSTNFGKNHDDILTDKGTPSFSRKLETICEKIEKISEKNESIVSLDYGYKKFETSDLSIGKEGFKNRSTIMEVENSTNCFCYHKTRRYKYDKCLSKNGKNTFDNKLCVVKENKCNIF